MNMGFRYWWRIESMENRIITDFQAWQEAGNECMDTEDLLKWQKEMAAIAYEAGQQSIACCGACEYWKVFADWPTGKNAKQFCIHHNGERLYDESCEHFTPRSKE